MDLCHWFSLGRWRKKESLRFFSPPHAKQVAANAKALNCRLDGSIIQAINDAIQQRGLVLGSRKV